MDRFKVTMIVTGDDLDPTDILDVVTDDIAPNLAARLEAFFEPDSICVESAAEEKNVIDGSKPATGKELSDLANDDFWS